MKKMLLSVLMAGFLAGCAADGSVSGNSGMAIGNALVSNMIDNQCRVELNNRPEWRAMALAVSAQKQAQWENQICGCASQEAPSQLSMAEMTQAAIDANARNTIVAKVVTKTVTSCLQRIKL